MTDPLRPKPRWRGMQPRNRKILVALDAQEHEVVQRALALWNKRTSSWSSVALSAWVRNVLMIASEQEIQRADQVRALSASELDGAKRVDVDGDPVDEPAAKRPVDVGAKRGDRQTKRRDPRPRGPSKTKRR